MWHRRTVRHTAACRSKVLRERRRASEVLACVGASQRRYVWLLKILKPSSMQRTLSLESLSPAHWAVY